MLLFAKFYTFDKYTRHPLANSNLIIAHVTEFCLFRDKPGIRGIQSLRVFTRTRNF